MQPTARDLAWRDPAAAEFLGLFPPGADFGDDYGMETGMEAGFGAFGAFGAVAPPSPAAAIMQPGHPANPDQPHVQAQMRALWLQHHHKMAKTQSRESLLYPNKDSELKIESYEFSTGLTVVGTGANVVTGTAASISNATSTRFPAVKIKPIRFFFSVNSYSMVLLAQVQVGNVNALIGGTADAMNYNQGALSSRLTVPTLETSTPVVIAGTYTGLTPPGIPPAFSLPLTATFQGPSEVTT
jgi:hypothetical protein